MSRKTPKTEILRALFVRSGNRCAFPGCIARLVNEKNQFIAQVCHIEAAETNGERFNPLQSNEERRAYNNLIVLCYPHHIETDDVATYGVDDLRRMKFAHEQQFELYPYKVDESLLFKVAAEMEEYWHNLDDMHVNHHVSPNVSLPIDATATYTTLATTAQELLESLWSDQGFLSASQADLGGDLLTFMQNSGFRGPGIDLHSKELHRFTQRDWETICLAIPNKLARLGAALEQMELRYLEEHLMLYPNDRMSRDRIDRLKQQFLQTATRSGLV